MKVGILLPTFSASAQSALAAAAAAAAAQLDGVFAYDHLWPMGSPDRPALAPFAVLAIVARRHPRLVVGPLVARVGLVSTPHLVNQFLTLEAMAPGRVIAALGTGDRLSAAENAAYGLAVRSADERRALLGDTARALRAVMPVWFGAGAAATNALARQLGVVVNLWNATPDLVRLSAAAGSVSWAGPGVGDLTTTLDSLAAAGATWAVLSPSADIERLGEWRRNHRMSSFR